MEETKVILDAIKALLAAEMEEEEEVDPDWCVYDSCGGNVDDAYEMGRNEGYQQGLRIVARIVKG